MIQTRLFNRCEPARFTLALIVAMSAVPACSLAPRQSVLPYPEHIQAGVEVGDEIEVETIDGETHRLTVGEVTGESLSGDGVRVAFGDIAALSKRSWKPAKNPCDDGSPLECSIPATVEALSDFHGRYGERFQASCVTHDFCYRYGFKTYDYDRAYCDAEFFENMKSQCRGGLALDPRELARCFSAALQFHEAVRQRGESSFLGAAGKYCEYAGPPITVSGR